MTLTDSHESSAVTAARPPSWLTRRPTLARAGHDAALRDAESLFSCHIINLRLEATIVLHTLHSHTACLGSHPPHQVNLAKPRFRTATFGPSPR